MTDVLINSVIKCVIYDQISTKLRLCVSPTEPQLTCCRLATLTLLLKALTPAALHRQLAAALQTLWLGSVCSAARVCSVQGSGRSPARRRPRSLFRARLLLGPLRADRTYSKTQQAS